ncbi:MAG TPA: HEAT repeat domain-containing protein [Planctomycetota bacterium]|nr:HEAT repeat domain-containing protein [Planctomycetota bacterium]
MRARGPILALLVLLAAASAQDETRVADLASPSASTRRDAALALAWVAKPTPATLEALERAVRDPDVTVRRAAALALSWRAPAEWTLRASASAKAPAQDEDEAVRRLAANAFPRLANVDPPGRTVLTALLRDDLAIQDAAATALARLGEVAPLREALGDARARRAAARAIGTMGERGRDAAPALIELVVEDEPVAEFADRALRRLGASALPALVKALTHERPFVRARACGIIRGITPLPAEAVPALVAALGDKEIDVAHEAERALARIEPPPPEVLTFVSKQLRSEQPQERWWGALVLAVMKPRSPAMKDVLAPALADENPTARLGCAATLVVLGEVERTSAVVAMLTSETIHEGYRNPTARILHEAGAAGLLVPGLLEALASADVPRRTRALGMLGELDVEIDGARLAAALHVSDPGQRRAMVSALRSSPRGLPLFLEALRDEDVFVRWEAASAIATIGTAAATAVPTLVAMARSHDAARPWAIRALGRIGPRAAAAAPVLVATLEDADATVRVESAVALGGLGESASEGIPALVRALGTDREMKGAAARSLALLGQARPRVTALEKARAPLVLLLRDPDTIVRRRAAAALGELGGRDAVAALLDALVDQDPYVRDEAALALQRIGSSNP